MSTIAQNKQLARRVFEDYWNKHNSDFSPDMYTNDFTLTDPYVPAKGKGLEASKSYFESLTRAFPDMKITIEEQLAEGDSVVTRGKATATHEGEILGVPASHTKTTLPVIVFHHFKNGKISNALVYWDVAGFLRAAGALAPTAMKATYAKP